MHAHSLPDCEKLRKRASKCRTLANAAHRRHTRDQLLQLANEFDELAHRINEMQVRSAAVARTFRKER
jgi:hypothetical protein